ncbi:hypothetical protein BDB01DRAFT_724432 [Pilobolus umbonatus]|nr:hypothetical protein BDB01DRAFT_724432 [Pilobolus umbonatus]
MKEPVDDNVLQEPVPFEDFKFSFGMDPDFSFPLEPTLPTPQLSFMQDPFLLFPNANTVLDENDQKAFSTFLDTFFIDSDLPSDGQLQSDYYQQLNEGKKKESEHVSKKIRSNKELLTEEEKRANHIASEQKRRSTIRTGFKELTELVPTLKNLNNSKSTVLFKSVEYIRYLDKRNSRLKEKVGSLELRVEVEGRMIQQSQPKTSHYPEEKNDAHLQGLPTNTRNALKAHKSQQKQLLLLQEQLQLHQRLIAQQQERRDKALQTHINKLPPILGQYDSNKTSLLTEMDDKAISAP